MSKPQWTPGPWLPSGRGSLYPDTTIEQYLYVITGYETDSGDDLICDVNIGHGSYAEQKANVHLIAAAPDLYNALEKALAAIAWWQNEHGCCHGATDSEIAEARAALAKARGEDDA